MPRVLVIGGSGMLGHMVSRTLASVGCFSVAYTSRRSIDGGFYFNAEQGVDGLKTILDAGKPYDCVVNCIGVLRHEIDNEKSQSIRRSILVNSLFPHDLAVLARDCGTRVIHMSTDGVFASGAGICLEDTPCNCDDLYGQSKRLGEAIEPNFLNIRCSILGPDPPNKNGILEWLRAKPSRSEVPGFVDQIWNGVTTLQFAQLCLSIIVNGAFDSIRAESPIHHFCPNQPVSKFELLTLLREAFHIPVAIRPVSSGHPISRLLSSRFSGLKRLVAYDRSMECAINELAALPATKVFNN